jgi:Tfp pilus assembly protein PilF
MKPARPTPPAPADLRPTGAAVDPAFANPKVAAKARAALQAFQAGQGDVAVRALAEARALAPTAPILWKLSGDVHVKLGARAAAIPFYEKAAELDPTDMETAANLGAVLRDSGRPFDAMVWLNRVITNDPTNPLALGNAAVAFMDVGEVSLGLTCAEEALKLSPGYESAQWARAFALFLLGRWPEAWAVHEQRTEQLRRSGGLRDIPGVRWDGSPLDGRTLLITVEQGAGDQLQFVRYLPRIPKTGGRVVLETYPALVPLMDGVAGADAVIPRDSAFPAYDVHLPIMSLPHVLAVGAALDGERCPYLAPPGACPAPLREALDQHRTRHGAAPRVGVVWAGAPGHANDHNRSAPFGLAAYLFARPGIAWVSLQKGPGTAALETLDPAIRDGVLDVGALVDDFGQTAHALADLDAVIAVDTSVAHLAGAMGIPTWLMVPFAPDWRWGTGADRTPWYPSMRLVRQPAVGAWGPVAERLTSDLAAWVAARAADPAAPAPVFSGP